MPVDSSERVIETINKTFFYFAAASYNRSSFLPEYGIFDYDRVDCVDPRSEVCNRSNYQFPIALEVLLKYNVAKFNHSRSTTQYG